MTAPPAAQKARLLSLDALRGATVALMILVNNAGDGAASFAQLRHSAWNGCTLTDLVFPLFLFLMGVSTAIAFASRRQRGVPKSAIAWQVLQRAAVMVLIGLVLNALPSFHLYDLRYCGVMQRIGICYAIAGILYVYGGMGSVAGMAVLGVIGYWYLLAHVAVPGFGMPGQQVPVVDPVGNLASYVDRLVIPTVHRYHRSFYDPEGLLSSIAAVATTCTGIVVGGWIRQKDVSAGRKLGSLSIAAVLLIAGAVVWSQTLPLNKRLWTSSYVLFTAGLSMALLALFVWAIDEARVVGERLLWPLHAFGMNALTAYVLSEVLAIGISSVTVHGGVSLQHWTYMLLPSVLGPEPMRSLLWSCLFVLVCFVPLAWMRRRSLIVKL
ncbi:DUF1624 domain-containing protein [Acidipila sp. EB88]|nr:DUF1624 domain-containing protein [Acidipila sp. EB88]